MSDKILSKKSLKALKEIQEEDNELDLRSGDESDHAQHVITGR